MQDTSNDLGNAVRSGPRPPGDFPASPRLLRLAGQPGRVGTLAALPASPPARLIAPRTRRRSIGPGDIPTPLWG